MSTPHLIPGVVIELAAATASTDVPRRHDVKDGRGTPGQWRPRTAFLFAETQGREWQAKLLERLTMLANANHLPHVSRPLEIGVDDQKTLFVLTARHQHSLTELFNASGLVDDPNKERAWRIFEQLVAGLAALHQLGMVHGGLHPESIGIDAGDIAWIVDAGWGPLEHWSRGAHLPRDAAACKPPERRADPRCEPTYRGDVYALGQIALRMSVGNAAAENRDEHAAALRQAGVSRGRCKIILALLADKPEDRQADAMEVKKLLALSRSTLVRWLSGATGLTAAALGLLAVIAMLFSQNGNLTEAVNSKENELAQARNELKNVSDAFGRLRGDKDELKTKLDQLDVKFKGQAALIAKLPKDELREQLEAKIDELNKLHKEHAAAKALNKQLEAFVPLTSAGGIDLDRLARREWHRLANDGSLTAQQMNDAIGKIPLVSAHLQGWYDAMEKPPEAPGYDPPEGVWWIRPRHAKTAKNVTGLGRRLDIQINDDRPQHLSHDWASATEHDYGNDKAYRNSQKNWIAVKWSPGDRITISMMYNPGAFSSWAPIIVGRFDGPMALWRLANEGLKSADGTEVELEIFRIHDDQRPGPIRDRGLTSKP